MNSATDKKRYLFILLGVFSLTLNPTIVSPASSEKIKPEKKSGDMTVIKPSLDKSSPPNKPNDYLPPNSSGPFVPHKKFPKDCSLCHVPKKWGVLKPGFRFDHLQETGFPLIGAHSQLSCSQCHDGRPMASIQSSQLCSSCHTDPHQRKMGMDCLQCHNQISWKAESLMTNHSQTRFPLTGIHATLECVSCHKKAEAKDFKGSPIECRSCHQQDYETAPNHRKLNFPLVCGQCHTTMSWSGATFNHSALGDFSNCISCHLPQYQQAPNHTQKNYPTACRQCHNTISWAGAQFNHAQLPNSTDCYACHQQKFVQAPNHVAKNFPHTCKDCHTTTTWQGALFNHSFLGNTIDCYSCHQPEFQQAPNHVAKNFPHTCKDCHMTTTWSGAQFNHAVLGNTADCYLCHQADFQRAPNHTAMNFPHTCSNCHTTTTWLGARFVHQFPLSGNHNVSCSICHPSGNGNVFTCLVCHEHRQSSMDSKHREQSGYSYDSLACYRCHPNGKH